jgi:hypothetical protein
MENAMNDKNRNLLIGGAATVLLGLFALSFLIKEEVPAPKPVPVVEEVHMPPPPPAATPEQIAAAEAQLASAAAEDSAAAAMAASEKKKSADKAKADLKKPAVAKLTDAEAKAKADKAAKARLEADARLAAKRSNEKKPLERIPEAAAPVSLDAAKPKEARFNMTQGGKKMTPEDFDAWMKAQGIRIVPAKPAVAPATPAVEPVKPEAGKEG